jgi:hypothetical protein
MKKGLASEAHSRSCPHEDEFIRDSSPFGNKAVMRKRVKQSNRGASSLCADYPPRSIAWGCEPMYSMFVARYAHPCVALARRANPS